MAMVACRECKEQISDEATKCPKCGVRLKKPQRSFFGKLCKGAFILFNLFMLWGVFAGVNNAEKHRPEQPDSVLTQNQREEAYNAGVGLGTGLMVIFWAAGDVVLGLFVLFTRPKND